MRKLNAKGFNTLEALIILVVLGLVIGTGWYVNHARKINSVNSYDACLKAEGSKTNFDEIDTQVQVPTCEIYGKKFTDTGKVGWDIGLRYDTVSHTTKLTPAAVHDISGVAPVQLVNLLKSDNASCSLGDSSITTQTTVFSILKVVDDKYAKLKYGCTRPDSYMLAKNDNGTWKMISPTNMFMEDGTPSCAMINRFDISKKIEPKCFDDSSSKVVIEDNKNI